MSAATALVGIPPLALWSASAALGLRAGVAVIGGWEQVVTPEGERWGQVVRLDLLAVTPTEYIPRSSDWVVTVEPETHVVRLYPATDGGAVTATFWHQDFNGRLDPAWGVRSGYLCTRSATHGLAQARAAEPSEPPELRDRVVWHVDRALDWLRDAATGQLARSGEPFELPDYRTHGQGSGTLAVYEDGVSLDMWRNAPRAGWVDLCNVGDRTDGARVAQVWNGLDGQEVYRPSWGTFVSEIKSAEQVPWVRLDTLPVIGPWQAPSTGAELVETALAQGVDLEALLRPVWRQRRGRLPALLVGSPIPEKVGDGDAVMHWQMLRMQAPPGGVGKHLRGGELARLLDGGGLLDWVPITENWHPDVVENRGRLGAALRVMRVMVAGAGALGSLVADALVRMGVHDVVLVDGDVYRAGNGVRHRLALSMIGYGKATTLALVLNQANPSARVRGFDDVVPSQEPGLRRALAEADLVVDCTASDALLRGVPALGLRPDARVVAGSVGLHAERLYVFGDRADAFSADTFDRWFLPYRQREHAAAAAEGMPQAAGCWHPVTPVPLDGLMAQAGRFVRRLDELAAVAAGPVAEAHELWGGARTDRAAA